MVSILISCNWIISHIFLTSLRFLLLCTGDELQMSCKLNKYLVGWQDISNQSILTNDIVGVVCYRGFRMSLSVLYKYLPGSIQFPFIPVYVDLTIKEQGNKFNSWIKILWWYKRLSTVNCYGHRFHHTALSVNQQTGVFLTGHMILLKLCFRDAWCRIRKVMLSAVPEMSAVLPLNESLKTNAAGFILIVYFFKQSFNRGHWTC